MHSKPMSRILPVLLTLMVPPVSSAPGGSPAGISRVEVTLMMPCSAEKATRATEALESIPGVVEVDFDLGSLRVRIDTRPDFDGDPTRFAQTLWEGDVYPHRIFVRARGRIELGPDGKLCRVEGGEQRFRLAESEIIARLVAEHGDGEPFQVLGEVTDWIEDVEPAPGHIYTLELIGETAAGAHAEETRQRQPRHPLIGDVAPSLGGDVRWLQGEPNAPTS